MIAEAVMLLGTVLVLLAAIGVVRFDDTLARMHALTKATTLGIVLVLVGAAFAMSDVPDVTALLLAAALQALTSPVSGHLIGRATYRTRLGASGDDDPTDQDGRVEVRIDVTDQLDP